MRRAVGIVEKIIGFMFLVPSSMLSAVSALAAQNFGAKKPERAKQTLKYAIAISTGIGFCAAVAVQFAAEPVVSLFTSDLAVIRAGGQYFRGYVWDSCIGGIQFSFSGYFCACGRSELSFLHNIISIVFVRIPGAFLASKLFADTLLPMGFASTAGSLVSTIVCLIGLCNYHQKRRRPHRPEPERRRRHETFSNRRNGKAVSLKRQQYSAL